METDAGDEVDERDEAAGIGGGDDDAPPEAPVTRRRLTPSSIALTVLVPDGVDAVDVRVTWGDYVTEPPLPEHVLTAEEGDEKDAPKVHWVRRPRESVVHLPVPKSGKGPPKAVPGSAAEQRPGGALELLAHARPFTIEEPGAAPRGVRALSVFLVNRRKAVTVAVTLPYDQLEPGFAPTLTVAFEARYEGLFGRSVPHGVVEVVTWRLIGREALRRRRFLPVGRDTVTLTTEATRRRPIYQPLADGFAPAPVYDRYRLPAGARLDGPLVVEERESTLVMPVPAAVRVRDDLSILVELEA